MRNILCFCFLNINELWKLVFKDILIYQKLEIIDTPNFIVQDAERNPEHFSGRVDVGVAGEIATTVEWTQAIKSSPPMWQTLQPKQLQGVFGGSQPQHKCLR